LNGFHNTFQATVKNWCTSPTRNRETRKTHKHKHGKPNNYA